MKLMKKKGLYVMFAECLIAFYAYIIDARLPYINFLIPFLHSMPKKWLLPKMQKCIEDLSFLQQEKAHIIW